MATPPTTEHLLQDIAWLKSLATRLASDRDAADDIVQEAQIAAWQRQPDTARPMRGWLTKVVRDVANMRRRSERRRAARHEQGEIAQAPATPDELLAQMQLQKRLVELVIELDEPYRSTIIARFVEGRTSAAIAASLGIPAGTVRKRLHEAIARLREGLDAEGGRAQWAPAVLAFAKGGVLVAKPTKLVVVVVAIVLAMLATVLVVLPLRGDDASSTSTSSVSSSTPSSAGQQATSSRTTAADASASSSSSEQRAADRAAMLAAITKARDARGGGVGGSATVRSAPAGSGSSSSATTLDIVDNTGDTSEWQKRALGTLNSLLGQCYDLGRAEDASVDGTITVRFTIVGEPGVGGVLEHVELVNEATTISQQTLRDCITQQLYALELDPPPDGVKVERELHLRFP